MFSISNATNTNYSNILTIDATRTTFYNIIEQSGANYIYQSGTGYNELKTIQQTGANYIYQLGTGSNTMKSITQTDANTIYQTGTGDNYLKNIVQVDSSIIYQVGTSTNTLKNTNFTGTVSLLDGNLFRVYNPSSTNFLQFYQYIYGSYIENLANYNIPNNNGLQSISFRTCNTTTGAGADNLIIQPGGVTVNQNLTVRQNLQVDGNLTFPNTIATKITYYTGYYTDIFQSTIIGLRNVVPSNGTHIFKVGDNDEVKIDSIYTTINNNLLQFGTNCIEQVGTGTNTFKKSTFNGVTTFNGNINLPTTYVARDVGQLGWTPFSDDVVISGNQSLFLNTWVNLSSITLPVGVWIVNGQICYDCVTAGTAGLREITIADGPTTAHSTCVEIATNIFHYGGTTDNRTTARISKIVVVGATKTIYLNFRFRVSLSGSYRINVSTQTGMNLSCVKIA
jgi:hypothetical protein